MFRLYQNALQRRPLMMQMISAGCISATGDVICQTLIEKRGKEEYNGCRTARFFGLACFYIAPMMNRWIMLLEKVRGSPRFLPLKKMLIDQICYAPLFYSTVIFNLRMLEGYGMKESWNMLVKDYWGIYKNFMKFWPCVQLITFYLMPLHFRVVFIQIASLFWNIFLSFKTQLKLSNPPM